jgi:hypothetical protein
MLLWGLACVPASAQTGWLLTPFLGVKFAGGTSIVDLDLAASSKKTVFGVSTSLLTAGLFGVEAEFAYVPGYFEDAKLHTVKASSMMDLTGNIIVSAPTNFTRGGLRPYLALGAGVMHAEAVDFLEVFRIRRSVPTASVGGGALGLLTNNVGVRFDVRYLRSFTNDQSAAVAIGRRISYWRFSVGLVRRF